MAPSPRVRRLRAAPAPGAGDRVSRPAPTPGFSGAQRSPPGRDDLEIATSSPRSRPAERLAIGHALILGALHGPAELLPVSSSGHTTVVPWLVGSPYGDLDPELRKELEVAMHAGAAAALLIARRQELADQLRHLDRRRVIVLAMASAPVALAGWRSERVIETRLGKPPTIAAGLLAGAVAMALADRSPEERCATDAWLPDALWLGAAQAFALIPGVSRHGATLAAARWLRFRRNEAELLSRQLAYPVIAGATLLKARRLRGWRRSEEPMTDLAAAAVASFASTLLTLRLFDDTHSGRRLLPYSVYRTGLAILILARLRRDLIRSAHRQGHVPSAW